MNGQIYKIICYFIYLYHFSDYSATLIINIKKTTIFSLEDQIVATSHGQIRQLIHSFLNTCMIGLLSILLHSTKIRDTSPYSTAAPVQGNCIAEAKVTFLILRKSKKQQQITKWAWTKNALFLARTKTKRGSGAFSSVCFCGVKLPRLSPSLDCLTPYSLKQRTYCRIISHLLFYKYKWPKTIYLNKFSKPMIPYSFFFKQKYIYVKVKNSQFNFKIE